MELIIGIIIGLIVGWAVPQPAFADKAIKKVKSILKIK